jgi:hypothetical protein
VKRQPARAQQRQGERELEDHEPLAQPVAAALERRRGLLERVVDVCAHRLPHGRAARQHTRERARREAEEQHRDVQPHVGFRGQHERRHERDHQPQQHGGERHPQGPADGREDEAFHDELPHDLAARRAEGAAHAGNISGTVRDTSDQPLSGAEVATTVGGHLAATDASGAYVLSGLEPGTYTVEASHAGYTPQSRPGVSVASGGTTTLDFRPPGRR